MAELGEGGGNMRRVATENPILVRGLQAAGQSGGGG